MNLRCLLLGHIPARRAREFSMTKNRGFKERSKPIFGTTCTRCLDYWYSPRGIWERIR